MSHARNMRRAARKRAKRPAPPSDALHRAVSEAVEREMRFWLDEHPEAEVVQLCEDTWGNTWVAGKLVEGPAFERERSDGEAKR
jgi:hypothetical protein